MIGLGSVVTEDMPTNALAYGNSARIRGFFYRCSRKLETREKWEDYVLKNCRLRACTVKNCARLKKVELKTVECAYIELLDYGTVQL